jgi:hypothetical protein
MKNLIKDRVSVADSMVLIGIGLAASYWVLESILNIFTSRDVNFFNQLLGPDINEIWPRISWKAWRRAITRLILAGI